jgi:hypothetical protein
VLLIYGFGAAWLENDEKERNILFLSHYFISEQPKC